MSWEWRHTLEIRRDGDRGRSLPCFILQRPHNDGLTKPRWKTKALYGYYNRQGNKEMAELALPVWSTTSWDDPKRQPVPVPMWNTKKESTLGPAKRSIIEPIP